MLEKAFLHHRPLPVWTVFTPQASQASPGVQFFDLKHALEETVADVEKQIARMEVIYMLLDGQVTKGSVHGLTDLIDEAFKAIGEQEGEPELRDMSIIFISKISKVWRWPPSNFADGGGQIKIQARRPITERKL